MTATNGTCEMVFSMPAIVGTGADQPNIDVSSFEFDYDFVGTQGQTLSGSSTTNLKVMVDVVVPVLFITGIESVSQGESKAVTLTWSNLYQAAAPTTNLTATASNGNAVTGLGINPATASCGAKSSSGATCSSSITTTSSTPVTADHKLNTITSGLFSNIRTDSVTFGVIPPPLMTFFAGNNGTGWNGNMLGQANAAPVFAGTPAMIVDRVNRQACTTDNCSSASENVNWVFKPNTKYQNEVSQLIGTANSDRLH